MPRYLQDFTSLPSPQVHNSFQQSGIPDCIELVTTYSLTDARRNAVSRP